MRYVRFPAHRVMSANRKFLSIRKGREYHHRMDTMQWYCTIGIVLLCMRIERCNIWLAYFPFRRNDEWNNIVWAETHKHRKNATAKKRELKYINSTQWCWIASHRRLDVVKRNFVDTKFTLHCRHMHMQENTFALWSQMLLRCCKTFAWIYLNRKQLKFQNLCFSQIFFIYTLFSARAVPNIVARMKIPSQSTYDEYHFSISENETIRWIFRFSMCRAESKSTSIVWRYKRKEHRRMSYNKMAARR